MLSSLLGTVRSGCDAWNGSSHLVTMKGLGGTENKKGMDP